MTWRELEYAKTESTDSIILHRALVGAGAADGPLGLAGEEALAGEVSRVGADASHGVALPYYGYALSRIRMGQLLGINSYYNLLGNILTTATEHYAGRSSNRSGIAVSRDANGRITGTSSGRSSRSTSGRSAVSGIDRSGSGRSGTASGRSGTARDNNAIYRDTRDINSGRTSSKTKSGYYKIFPQEVITGDADRQNIFYTTKFRSTNRNNPQMEVDMGKSSQGMYKAALCQNRWEYLINQHYKWHVPGFNYYEGYSSRIHPSCSGFEEYISLSTGTLLQTTDSEIQYCANHINFPLAYNGSLPHFLQSTVYDRHDWDQQDQTTVSLVLSYPEGG
ncbi:hypothetical protein FQR65_LT15206 [Abscondita terminalis]|nr:hypothetical protein FQR65_LT15206 [Abscondita terminalis]